MYYPSVSSGASLVSIAWTSSLCFSAHKLHIHDHAATLYTFVTLTTPTHQGAFNSDGSLPTIACLDREKRFTGRNGGPTRQEDCFLSPVVQRRREMDHPSPTKSFSRPRREMVHPAPTKSFSRPSPEAAICYLG